MLGCMAKAFLLESKYKSAKARGGSPPPKIFPTILPKPLVIIKERGAIANAITGELLTKEPYQEPTKLPTAAPIAAPTTGIGINV